MAQPYQSLLALPLVVEKGLYGAVVLYYARSRQFSAYDLKLAAAFTEQVALAIENAHLRAQAEQATLAAERNRLARELHEAVTQSLFSSSIIADILPRLFDRNPEEGKKRLAELRDAVKGALSEMRVLLLELRPRAITEMRLSDLLQELANATSARTRIPTHLTVEGDRPLPLNVRIAFYRIAQEALNNVAQHAAAGHIAIHLRFLPKAVELSIQDDGRGFDVKAGNASGRGIKMMRERAQSIGAKLKLDSQTQAGACVTVVWNDPYDKSYQN
jgi:signal transduction histidine kinase